MSEEKSLSARERILQEAIKQIDGEREKDYGSPEDNFQIIADFWSQYTGTKITSLDVAMMMCLLKIARIKNGGGTGDSFVDLAGYASCGAEIAQKGVKGMTLQEAFSHNLLMTLERKGISCEKLAEKTGVSSVTIYHIRNGRRNPTLDTAVRIADGLGVELGELIKGRKKFA